VADEVEPELVREAEEEQRRQREGRWWARHREGENVGLWAKERWRGKSEQWRTRRALYPAKAVVGPCTHLV
jgi:hypothetical protein